ncbi:MAG: DUF5765 domain-containing protein [Methylobacter sp.]
MFFPYQKISIWIDESGVPQNQLFTLLGYVLIIFQPFFY